MTQISINLQVWTVSGQTFCLRLLHLARGQNGICQ